MFPGRFFPARYFNPRYWVKLGAASLAPVVETTEVGIASSASTSVFVDKPAGTANGELIIFPHGSDGGSGPPALMPPVGGVEIVEAWAPSDASVGAVHRLTTGPSEPAQYEAFCSESEKQVLIALRITGTDPEDAIDGFASQGGTNAQTPTSPDLTTVAANCRIIRVLSLDYQSGTLTPDTGYPPGTTGHYIRGSNINGGAGATILGSADEVKGSPGSVGTAEWTISGAAAASWVAFTVAIKPGTFVPTEPIGNIDQTFDQDTQAATGTAFPPLIGNIDQIFAQDTQEATGTTSLPISGDIDQTFDQDTQQAFATHIRPGVHGFISQKFKRDKQWLQGTVVDIYANWYVQPDVQAPFLTVRESIPDNE